MGVNYTGRKNAEFDFWVHDHPTDRAGRERSETNILDGKGRPEQPKIGKRSNWLANDHSLSPPTNYLLRFFKKKSPVEHFTACGLALVFVSIRCRTDQCSTAIHSREVGAKKKKETQTFTQNRFSSTTTTMDHKHCWPNTQRKHSETPSDSLKNAILCGQHQNNGVFPTQYEQWKVKRQTRQDVYVYVYEDTEESTKGPVVVKNDLFGAKCSFPKFCCCGICQLKAQPTKKAHSKVLGRCWTVVSRDYLLLTLF